MPSGGASERYRVRDLIVDVTGASVSRGGERIVLPPRTLELLVALVRRYPSTVRRHDLLDAVWPDEHVTDQTLSHRVMALRKALGDHAEVPEYVAGERGFGYRLVAEVATLEGDAREPQPAAAASPPAWPGSTIALAAVLVALLLAGARSAWKASSLGGVRAARASPAASVPIDDAARQARVRRLCLRGEFFFLTFTREGLRRSAEAWGQAVTLDPAQARAHAGRALTESARALLGFVALDDAERQARDGALRALELDPASPPGQLAASLVRLLFDWDPARAVAGARAASERDPEDLRGPIVVGLALLAQGRLEEGQQILHAAVLVDPNAPAPAYLEGRAHEMQARWTEAASAYARALALEPDLVAAGRGSAESLAAAGQHDTAFAALALRPEAGRARLSLGQAWRELCREGTPSLDAVHACLLGGERERAEQLLAAAVDARAPWVVLAPHDALLQPLRGGPAMERLAAQLGAVPGERAGPRRISARRPERPGRTPGSGSARRRACPPSPAVRWTWRTARPNGASHGGGSSETRRCATPRACGRSDRREGRSA
jgi:DNA-binding winged helix-turn-helix (wHTH) protein/tetratricopeptide (TPR) repeat protein